MHENFKDEVFARYLHKPSGLLYVDSVELANDPEVVEWYREVTADELDNCLARRLFFCRNRKKST